MARKFVNDNGGKFKVELKDKASGGKAIARLLWGDSVRVVATDGAMVKVKSRGMEGWIPKSTLTDEGLLEIYVIDVGQGDGVLMRTPDDAWHVIDAGVANEAQMTKKGAANFIRWKFIDDLEADLVSLKNVIVSHSDFDHYGGLLDLLAGRVERPVREFAIEVENFFHCGMGRFEDAPKLGRTVNAKVEDPPFPGYGVKNAGSFITELLDGKQSFRSPARPFDRSFSRLAKLVGSVPKKVRRLSDRDEHLPGYEPGDGPVVIRVLGPVEESIGQSGVGLREFADDSKTRNGHSIVLRVDFGKVRVLLTGDLNTDSQRLLLSHHHSAEFASDVAKGCHHGSDDIDLRFVRAMNARATIVSSGDNEDYAHPRPRVLGASARYGRESRDTKGNILPPLLYSTELARSVKLADVSAVRAIDDEESKIAAADAEAKTTARGAKFVPLTYTPIATDLVYGLINVRTDGSRVLCGYMEESGCDFDIQVFLAGVEP